MRHLKGFLKAFYLAVWLFIISWVITFITSGGEWYDTTVLITAIIVKAIYILLFLIVFNLAEAIITRKKRYYYMVQYRYTPTNRMHKSFSMQFSIRTKKPIGSLDKFIREHDISDAVYANKGNHTLDNGTIAIKQIIFTGSNYKY